MTQSQSMQPSGKPNLAELDKKVADAHAADAKATQVQPQQGTADRPAPQQQQGDVKV
jgi:hypothetical protein